MIAVRDLQSVLGSASSGLPDEELARIRPQMRRAAGLGAPLSLDSLARSAISRARFRSNVTPSVEWDPMAPTAASAPGGGGGVDLGPLLQPTLDVTLETGQTITIAPYGEATGDYRLIVGGVVIGVFTSFAVAVAVGYWLGGRSRRGRGRRAR
jgi:hypothetical protein